MGNRASAASLGRLASAGRLAVLLLGMSALVLGGCRSMDRAADKIFGNKNRAPVEYSGLKSQNCAVMVWADRGTRVDYPMIQADIAQSLQARLLEGRDQMGVEEVEKAEFINPLSVLRYQRDHPEINNRPITEVAPRLGVARLIYFELDRFETRSPMSVELLRGSARGTLRVLEVNNDQAKVVLEQPGIEVSFPPNSSEGVAPSGGITDRTIYQGTVKTMAYELAKYFCVYDSD